ncbi:hypothetical protein [Gemmatimonas groenlandica]|uniref:Uncharacterized protein n=1 Tax=Gemmatimonas groenlandica TaxID=2732249 RepID=A0A6M4IRT7_9BACT|nr:hypothetical protein [Gemmatimonas groenlandica]QJR37483.1 hypothetical protein HKW67_19175 [Gemmatimonas groenlandica]
MNRAFRFATPALAALAALTLAACGEAPSTAPEQTVEMDATNAAFVPRIVATVNLVVRETPSGNMIGNTTVAFTSGSRGTPVNIVDNSTADADKRSGYFQVTLTKSTIYEATVIAGPSKYDRTEATKQIGSSASTVNMGTQYLPVNPLFTINVKRATTGALLGGATYTVGWADGTAPWMQRTDNVDDMSGIVGVITFYGRSARNHQICEITAPTGYLIPSPSCKLAYATWGKTASVDFVH